MKRGTRIWIEQPDDAVVSDQQIGESPRIGATSGHELELRFFLKGSAFLSGTRET